MQSQHKNTKKKIVKRLKRQVTSQQDKTESKGNTKENKVYTAQQERRKQFDKVEAKHNQEFKARGEEANRLREAMILSEIIGQPRCKMRHNRRARRIEKYEEIKVRFS